MIENNIDLKYIELLERKFEIKVKQPNSSIDSIQYLDMIQMPSGLSRLSNFEDFYNLDPVIKSKIVTFLETNDEESLTVDNNKITKQDMIEYFNVICDVKVKVAYKKNYKKKLLAEMLQTETDNLRITDYTTVVPISNELIEEINKQIRLQQEALKKNIGVFSKLNKKLVETEKLNEALKTRIATESSVEKITRQIKEYSIQRSIFGVLIIVAVALAVVISAFLLTQDELVQNVFEDFKTSLVFVSLLVTMYSILLNFLIKNYNNSMSMLENKKEKLHNLELFMSLSSSEIELGSDLESVRKKLLSEILTIKGNNWDKVDSSNIIRTALSKNNTEK